MKNQHLSYADWARGEYAAIVRSLLQARINKEENARVLTTKLSQLYAPSSVFLMKYGHYAIQMARNTFKRR